MKLRLLWHFAIICLHFYRENYHLWSLNLSYIDKFSAREINLASPFWQFFLLFVSRNLSTSLSSSLILTFKFIRFSSWRSFSSSVRTSLCRGSIFAIRDRAAATRIMTFVTRKSGWPKRNAELVPARSSVSFIQRSFFSSLDLLSILVSLLSLFLFNFISEIELMLSIDTIWILLNLTKF